MKKVKILIPVYNDWESLIKLLDEINKVISDIKNTEFDCMIVNDASTIKLPEIKTGLITSNKLSTNDLLGLINNINLSYPAISLVILVMIGLLSYLICLFLIGFYRKDDIKTFIKDF